MTPTQSCAPLQYPKISCHVYQSYFASFSLLLLASEAVTAPQCYENGWIIEPHPLQAPPEASAALPDIPELRVSTITPQSASLLQRATDWQDVAPPRSVAFSDMQVCSLLFNGNNNCKIRAQDVLAMYGIECRSCLHVLSIQELLFLCVCTFFNDFTKVVLESSKS